ncbi:MAG: hypothetical protein M1433_00790 [Candidatus Parvarchaeota archaeon]|nr:hypothetical protein [Candidatus Parvarchaeota archaeon]
MKVKVIKGIKKVAAVATGALFVGATMGVAAVFGSGLNSLPSTFIHNGAVNAVVVVGSTAQPIDILGAIDVASALTAAAAAQHTSSGTVQIGTLSLSSAAHVSSLLSANGTSLGQLKTSGGSASATLSKVNFSYGKQSIALKNANYTAVENVSFSSTAEPYFNGLNVVFPAGSYSISSYVYNRTGAGIVSKLTDNLQYLIGNKMETLINFTTKNFTVGQVQTYTYEKVPSSITLGTHTINLLGIATIGASSPSSSYNQLEFNINGGATNYMNFSKTVTTNGVTLTLGSFYVSNTSGTFLSSLGVSSSSLVQNTSNTVNVFGLGDYNASFPGGVITLASTHFINFTSTAKQTLTASLSAAATPFSVVGLSNITLEALTHHYSAGNISVVTGAAGKDTFKPVSFALSPEVSFTLTHGLPNVNLGADFRGALNSASSAYSNDSGPDFTLEPFQWYYNTTGARNNVSAPSEIIFPLSTHDYVTNTSGVYSYVNQTSKKIPVALLVQLPNGKSFALQFSPVLGPATVSNNQTMNATILYNGSYASPQTVVIGKEYNFGGYNLTTFEKTVVVGNSSANHQTPAHVVAFNITGPVASLTNAGSGTLLTTGLSVVPGFNKLYASNGTALSSYALPDQLGSLSFDGSKITFTEPFTGGTQSVSIVENKSNFYTNVSTPTNTSADTYGAFVTGASVHGAEFVIPTQNYTLALGGSTVIGSTQNYSVGQTIPNGGKVLGIGSSGFTASSLFGTNVFPLAVEDSSFTASSASVPVIVVGGPSVNTLAQSLLGVPAGSYGAGFTNKTGVVSGQSLVQFFSNVSSLNGQDALVIAGYNGADTLQAAEVVSESLLGTPVVTLTGTKMILSSGSSYSGVTVVSSS